jgi:hypothetical protein
MEQLKCWRSKGYYVSLNVVGKVEDSHWVLIVGTEPTEEWMRRDGYDLGLRRQRVRFVSEVLDSPEACI